MQTKTVIILFSLCGLAAGLILGGIIGHFATKSTNIVNNGSISPKTPTPSTSSQNQEKPDAKRDARNREFLFAKTSATAMEKDLRELSSKPHLAGSPENEAIANMIEQRWKDFGFKTHKDSYNVLLSYPGDKDNRNKAEILAGDGSVTYTCKTEEKVLDPVQENARVIPPFNAYAKNGIVESSKIYYLNYCTDRDFQQVEGQISLTGAIVICRYGKIFRGNKVKHAEDRGAVGVIIYNDPFDYAPPTETNATYAGTFPNTRFLPPSGAQRGSVATGYNGDPLTPGYPSKDYPFRRTVDQVRAEGVLRSIPTQPMGYEDAEKFLLLLNNVPRDNVVVPEKWRGSIKGVQYKIGGQLPDGKKIRIINNNKEERKDIANLFGIIEGAVEPDRYVLLGNHYDAWMFGATDALSGTIAVLETSRVYAELLQTGWRPRRTIIFCLWDAEEYALIGSSEFVENLRTVLEARAVAYINLDSPVLLPEEFIADGSPLLHNVLYETAKLVPYPNVTGKTIYDVWLEVEQAAAAVEKPRIHDADAGSDDATFYHYTGIPTADISFTGSGNRTWEDAHPLYHTTYATFKNVKQFFDPTFSYHQAVSRFVTEMVRSLADSVIIPFKTEDYATRLQRACQEILDNNVFKTRLSVKNLEGSLDRLKAAIDKFESVAKDFDDKARNVNYTNVYEVRRINDQLSLLERSFLFPLGVLENTHLRHVIFAPSSSNAYAGTAFPGIIDSLYKDIAVDDTTSWDIVKNELTKAIYVIESASTFLQSVGGDNFW